MITAVDTDVLLDVFGADPTFGAASKKALGAGLDAGRLVIWDLVWAKTVASFPDERAAEDALGELGVTLVATEQPVAARAGTTWRRYRKARVNRSRLIADFLVGAHALLQTDRLLTRDREFFRTYFEDLTVLDPTEPEE